jgi:hypothetical protein
VRNLLSALRALLNPYWQSADRSRSLSVTWLDLRTVVLGVEFKDFSEWDGAGYSISLGLGPLIRVDFYWGMR